MLLSGPLANTVPSIAIHITDQPHQFADPDLQSIRKAHLFGELTDTDDTPHDSDDAPQISRSLLLVGTVATADPANGIAIISFGGTETLVLPVGDKVNGVTLQEVYLDHVILYRKGKFVTLRLPVLQSTTGGAEQGPLIKSADVAPRGPRDLRDLAEAITAKAAIDDESKKLRGFIIQPNKISGAFWDFGLRPGDLVIAVNGTTVVDQDLATSQKIVDSMLRSHQASITIARSAEAPQDIALDIGQFGESLPTPAR